MAGYEYEVMPNTSLGVRYIRRTIGRVLEDSRRRPWSPTTSASSIAASTTS